MFNEKKAEKRKVFVIMCRANQHTQIAGAEASIAAEANSKHKHGSLVMWIACYKCHYSLAISYTNIKRFKQLIQQPSPAHSPAHTLQSPQTHTQLHTACQREFVVCKTTLGASFQKLQIGRELIECVVSGFGRFGKMVALVG